MQDPDSLGSPPDPAWQGPASSHMPADVWHLKHLYTVGSFRSTTDFKQPSLASLPMPTSFPSAFPSYLPLTPLQTWF